MTLAGQERHCSTPVPFDLGLGLAWLKTRLRFLPSCLRRSMQRGTKTPCPREMSSSYHQINSNQCSARRQQFSTTATTTTVTCATIHRFACYELRTADQFV